MASVTTAWLIGSTRKAEHGVIFTGNASLQKISGDLYLHHSTPSLSLLSAMMAGGVANPVAILTRDRRVKLSSSGTFTASPNDGSTSVVTHGARTDQRWSVSHVALDRVRTPDELGGEWVRLFAEVAAKGSGSGSTRRPSRSPARQWRRRWRAASGPTCSPRAGMRRRGHSTACLASEHGTA